MKKTLIALIALAGVAAADTYTASEANTWLQSAGSNIGGSKYTLTFTIADTFAPAFGTGYTIFDIATLDNKMWSIYQQDGRYLGLGEGEGPDGSYASRNDTSVNYVDTDTASAESTADYSGWFYDSGATSTALAGATISIASKDGSTDITFTTAGESPRSITLNRSTFLGVLGSNAGVSLLKFTNVELSSVSLTYDGGTLTIPAKSVPEPATATLSLLALAGLAARRRRK